MAQREQEKEQERRERREREKRNPFAPMIREDEDKKKREIFPNIRDTHKPPPEPGEE